MKTESVKNKQISDLKEQCLIQDVDFNSMLKLLNSEKIKKLQKRNHYIQQTIDREIEKSLDNGNK